jgi:hypothetical protein
MVVNMSAGPLNEIAQKVTFVMTTVTLQTDSFFDMQPQISANDTINFKPARDQGTIHYVITLVDDEGTEYGGENTSKGALFIINITLPTSITESTRVVTMTVSLPFTIMEFTDDEQTKFKASIAKAAGVSIEDVTIDRINTIPASRRCLLVTSIRVDYVIKAQNQNADDSIAPSLTAFIINAQLGRYAIPTGTVLQETKTSTTPVNDPPSFDLLLDNTHINCLVIVIVVIIFGGRISSRISRRNQAVAEWLGTAGLGCTRRVSNR